MQRSPLALGALIICAPLAAQTSWVQSPINGHWYRLTAPQPWTDAEAEAVRDGAHLATVRSQAEMDWILRQFGLRNLWIGLSDTASEGNFVWTSGEHVVYANWCPGEPNAFTQDEDHVHISDWCIDRVGGWNDQQDDDPYPGLVEATTAPDGWVRNPGNGHWYRRTAPLTWQDGERTAVREGGHLATVRSQVEQDWLQQEFGTGPLWIGLNDAAVDGRFAWTSGEPFSYRNWCPNQPSASTADHDFVFLDSGCAQPGGWADGLDATSRPAIIERTSPPGSGLAVFGHGCPGRFGTPVLSAEFGSQLLIGGRFDLRVDTLSPNPIVVPFGLVGFDDQVWNGHNLPVALDGIGMTGCDVFIDVQVDQRLYKQGTTAQWSLPVPNRMALVGHNVYLQALVVEPAANPFGAILSNAGRATLSR